MLGIIAAKQSGGKRRAQMGFSAREFASSGCCTRVHAAAVQWFHAGQALLVQGQAVLAGWFVDRSVG